VETSAGELLPAPLAEGVGYLLARAGGRAIRDLNRALQQYGMRSRHYTVLVVAADGGRSQRELSDMLGLDPSAVVAVVDDLARQELVRREPHPVDRRTRIVVATEQGMRRLQEVQDLARDVDASLQARLSPDEQRTLVDLLRRIAVE
jgi:DNA-binding MarR family transcriptional regulator